MHAELGVGSRGLISSLYHPAKSSRTDSSSKKRDRFVSFRG